MTAAVEKIVVCFRMPAPGTRPGQPNGYLPRARALAQRAEALGATLAAWSAVTIAFAFDPDSLEEAIDLVASVVTEPVLEVERWACGIANGPMEPLGVAAAGARSDLAWGEALVLALTLSRVARAGEVLVNSGVDKEDALRVLDARVANDGGFEVRGHRLDTTNPWKRRPSMTRIEPYRTPDATTPSPAPAAARPSVTSEGRASVTNEARRSVTNEARASVTNEARPSATNEARPSVTNEARRSVTNEGHGSITSVMAAPPVHLPPRDPVASDVAARESRIAFLARDREALGKWTASLADVDDGFASRMRAFADLSRGDLGRALRTLEAARDAAQGPARCQATLALAVALAGIGNLDDALLEGLDALARARELCDVRAEDACMRFMTLLTTERMPMAEAAAAALEEQAMELDIDIDEASI